MTVPSLWLRTLLPVALLLAGAAASAQNDVTLQTSTNGNDADSPPGPALIVSDPVTWTYEVINTGNRELSNIVVTDDQGVVVTCPATTLDAGFSMTCTANGTVFAGQYANVGTVTAELPDTTVVNDSDPSHYFGQAAPGVQIETSTQGEDADTATGPVLAVGEAVNWNYEITNISTDDLINIEVTDDQGVVVTCPATDLLVGASMTCTASGVAQVGQYANTGSVLAELPSTDLVADSDPSHYFGQTVLIETATNGDDADTMPGPSLQISDPVNWTYEVTNPGPAMLASVLVTDDQGVTVSCPQSTLAAGESMTCSASGSAVAGQYANIGSVSATLPLGGVVGDSDPSHYFVNVIAIEKATNGIDADTPPGLILTPGDGVSWTYEITNLDTDALTAISVSDSQGETVTCPGTTLAVGESMICTASNTAISGQYANLGLVEATSNLLGAVSASDMSHYLGQTEVLDFGDSAEPPYQVSLAQNGARHLLGSGVFLGACVDSELDAVTSSDASGDDLDAGVSTFGTCAVAGNDDDGISFNGQLLIGLNASIDVIASEPCTLSAWIDYDADGLWGDAEDELFPGGSALIAGSNALNFDVPATAIAGSTFARFRCTSDGAVGFTGSASDGEVEDYAVTIVQPTPGIASSKSVALLIDVDSDSNVDPGDTLRYTVLITNNGSGVGNSVQFSDTPDANTALVAGSVTTTQGSVDTGNGGGDSNVLVTVGDTAAAATVNITFDVIVDDPLPLGVSSVSNQGEVSGGNFTSLLTDDAAVGGASDPTVTALQVPPAVTASKSATLLVDVDSDGNVDPGDTLAYTIVINNAGTGDALAVQLDDLPDANSALVVGSVTTSQGSVSTGNGAGDVDVTITIGTLSGLGGAATVNFQVVVDDPLAIGVSSVSNQGTASGSNFADVLTDDPAVGGASDPTVTALQVPPAVTASKSAALLVDVDSDSNVDPGDTLRYTVLIANNGTGIGESLQFSDVPDANTALVVGSVTTTQGSVDSGNAGGDSNVLVTVGDTASAATVTVTFDVIVDDPLPLGVSSVSNQGMASGGNFADVLTDDPAVGGASDPTVTALQVPPAVTASKTAALLVDVDSDSNVDPGDTLRYTVLIANNGTGIGESLQFSDAPDANTALVVGSVTTTQGSVDSGNAGGDSNVLVTVGDTASAATVTVTFDVIVDDPLPLGVSSVSNQGTASGGNFADVLTDDPAVGGASDPTVTALNAPPAVTVSKIDALLVDLDSDGNVDAGDTVGYTITISNAGTGDALAAQLDDLPDANTALVVGSVTTSQGSVSSGNGAGDANVSIALGALAGLGGSTTVTFQVVVDDPLPLGVTSVSNQAMVSGSNFATVASDDSAAPGTADPTVTPLQTPPSLAASKAWSLHGDVDSDGNVDPGDTLRYTVLIANNGTGIGESLQFSDVPDANTALIVGSVTTTQGSVDNGNGGGDGSVLVTVGDIASAATVTLTFDVIVDDPLPLGVSSVLNQGTVSGSNFANVLTDDPAVGGASDPTVTALSAPAAVTASKTDALLIDLDSDGNVDPGDTLRYTISLDNSGTGDALAVLVSDTPDGNSTLLVGSVTASQGSIGSGNSTGDDAIAVNLDTLPGKGGSATIVFDVTVNDPLPAGVTTLSNQASVSGDNFATLVSDDPAIGGANDSTITLVQRAPLLAASKTVSLQSDLDADGNAEPGDTLRYSVTVSNSGTGAAEAVALTDTPDANTTLVSGSVQASQGAVSTGNGAGDSSVAVAVGTLAGQVGTATVLFDVTINSPLAADVSQISNQALVQGDNFADLLSDDPSVAGSTDPTVTSVTATPLITASNTVSLHVDAPPTGGSASDQLRYTVTIVNSGSGGARDVQFVNVPGDYSTLLVGSVAATQGVVTAGNGSGDTSIEVDLGDIAGGGGAATITFIVQLDASIPRDVTSISNSGSVSGANFAAVTTDDPTTDGADATVFALQAFIQEPTTIPATDLLTLIGLVALLLLLGRSRVRARP